MTTPRFVRPAWLTARADGRSSAVGLGPRSRDGMVSGRVTLRTAEGEVSRAVTFDAGGRSDDGAARMVIDVPRGMLVEIDGSSTVTRHIVIRPNGVTE
jgi:hypothetical protein